MKLYLQEEIQKKPDWLKNYVATVKSCGGKALSVLFASRRVTNSAKGNAEVAFAQLRHYHLAFSFTGFVD